MISRSLTSFRLQSSLRTATMNQLRVFLSIAMFLVLLSQYALCDNNIHYTSTYGLPCVDECGLRGQQFYWCHVHTNTNGYQWDYCSPRADVTFRGNPCRANHPCGKYWSWSTWSSRSRYYWCYLESGSPEKCGLVE